ncbi:transcriptional regulator [Methanomethylovorans hollandica DSM 15978]|uniref:Transcriptional regulator n=1 Tax=Methanomethylovorans hollandica (strain DSM 15978 / NBRC 107637 / DMS1) TaxID=867904 RepID=L0KYD8_METHD|nr:TetR/AcrR family transcriptional regulator [Methanomethylovorans hollandica]AGB50462.1 transcriptional regulator [Methanomethylovorans hollandica DSM 15978]
MDNMSLRQKRKIETKNRIFEVSGKLFKEKGFESTTIDEITKEAGIAKGTFFNYFPTKESLVFYFAEQKAELVYGLTENETIKHLHTKERIKKFLVALAESYENDKELTKLLFFEYRRYIEDSRNTPDKERNPHYRLIKVLLDLLQEGIKKREVKESIDTIMAAEILNAMYFHTLMVWLKSENELSFSRNISVKIDLLFEGIGDRS